MKLPWLYFILDLQLCRRTGTDPIRICKQGLEAGVRMVQLRTKDLSGILPLANKVRALTSRHNAVFIINDYLELAEESGADGLHVGQEDIPVTEARKLLGAGRIVGVSVHSRKEAERAVDDGADYIGVGPAFFTTTKKTSPLGIAHLKRVTSAVSIPAFLIGGISPATIGQIKHLKHHGVAVASAIIKSDDIRSTVKKLVTSAC